VPDGAAGAVQGIRGVGVVVDWVQVRVPEAVGALWLDSVVVDTGTQAQGPLHEPEILAVIC